MVLVASLAIDALQASICLCTNTNTVTDLDVLDVGSDLDGFTDDLVANTACCSLSEKLPSQGS